jgi:bacillithiol system protein YtxJ
LNWLKFESESDLENIIAASFLENNGVVIFKHSTRCSISSVAKSRLESSWDFDPIDFPVYYLDLISFRALSALVAEKFNVRHESPQILVIKNGECIFKESHMSISVKSIRSELGA